MSLRFGPPGPGWAGCRRSGSANRERAGAPALAAEICGDADGFDLLVEFLLTPTIPSDN